MKAWFLFLSACSLPLTALADVAESSQRIDQVLAQHWKSAGVTPHSPASDEVFVRRIYLDAVGRIPSAEEAEAFLTTSHPDKRAHLIDELLDSPGYANHMFNWWADLLRLRSRIGNNQVTGLAYAEYLRQSLEQDMPYDQFTRELLTAEGFSWDNGAVGFYVRDAGMPLDHLATTVQVFLGTQIVCAQCHDHPFDSWTQMDYYHLAAFTYGVVNQPDALLFDRGQLIQTAREEGMGRRGSSGVLRGMNEVMRPLRGTSAAETGRTLRLPQDYQYDNASPRAQVDPKVPFGPDLDHVEYTSRTEALAEWLASPENPRFTLTISNRLWKKAFGLGVIEPVDDLTDRSLATVPELMPLLEDIMREVGYSQKEFLRVVFNTGVYQREASRTEPVPGETYHFTGPLLRRMTAEQAWDSFVTLMHGDPDRHTMILTRRQPTVADASAELRVLVAGIVSRSPRETLELARESARLQGEGGAEVSKLTERLRKARDEGDQAAVRRIGRELYVARNRLRNEVMAVAAMGVEENMAPSDSVMMMQEDEAPQMMMEQRQGRRGGGGRDGYDQMLAREIAAELGVDLRDNRDQLRSWMSGPVRQYLRASHISQPAPRGHFLRLFGQSDREVIENASLDGSIGQALNLLNGPVFNHLQHPLSAYQRSIRRTNGDPLMQAEKVYLNLLSRRPTGEEIKLLEEVARQQGNQFLNEITFALLNGQEFLFVQ